MAVGIGFSLQAQYSLPITQVIPILCENGFSAVSPVWTPELDIRCLADCAKLHRMTIQSLHATHKDTPLLWEPENEKSQSVFQNIMKSIDDCSEFDIPILVVHGWQGFDYDFSHKSLNFGIFDKFVQRAEEKGISIAFENLEGEEFLCALMERYREKSNVGYCWDSGHDNCYPHETNFLEKFGERLIMTHLNDNFGLRDPEGVPTGDDDLHLIPYDGVIDWDKALLKLKKHPKQKILNFEIKTSSHSKAEEDLIYKNLSLSDFIAKVAKSARIIAEKYSQLI